MRRMNFPEKSKINITQLWPCPPAQPIPDFTVSYPREPEPLIPSPFSLHFCQVGAKCPKSETNIFLNIFWKQGPGFSSRRLSKKSCPFRPPDPSQRVRLEKLACLKFIWLGDLRICPFRAPKHVFSRQNGKIQVAEISGF